MSQLRLNPDSGHPPRLTLPEARGDGFHCGEPIDVSVAGRWIHGRVEWSESRGGWYLCGRDGDGWCPLRPGMTARIPRQNGDFGRPGSILLQLPERATQFEWWQQLRQAEIALGWFEEDDVLRSEVLSDPVRSVVRLRPAQ